MRRGEEMQAGGRAARVKLVTGVIFHDGMPAGRKSR